MSKLNISNSLIKTSLWSIALSYVCWSLEGFTLESDRDQPLQIVADLATRDEKAGETRYEGNVVLSQGSLRIKATRISIRHSKTQAEVIVATGSPATLVQQPSESQPPVDASADRIEFTRSQDLVRFLGNARIQQQGSTLSGSSIDYLVSERTVRAAGATDGVGRKQIEMVIPPENLRSAQIDD